ncbi:MULTISPECIES: hypothetical protein [Nitrosomonas]|nr:MULTISPECIES: hypothetical protein [Nitrosomonas]
MSVPPSFAAQRGDVGEGEQADHRNMQRYEEASQGPQYRDPCGKTSRQQ